MHLNLPIVHRSHECSTGVGRQRTCNRKKKVEQKEGQRRRKENSGESRISYFNGKPSTRKDLRYSEFERLLLRPSGYGAYAHHTSLKGE